MGRRRRTPRRNAAAGPPPGSIYRNRNRYRWSVQLPGTHASRSYPLIPGGRIEFDGDAARVIEPPGAPRRATTDPSIARAIAWELWHEAVRLAAARDAGP